MNGYLRQSTASQARLIGPFIDDTDFKTAKTALSIANTDVKLRANGTTLANKNSGGGTHQVNGLYSLTWDATDTANVGELFYSVVVASALQVFGSYVVLEEAVYDALFAASAPGYLQPTTAGRTLDVSATGEAGVDWANVGAPTTVVGLSGTTIKAVTDGVTVTTNNDKTGYALSSADHIVGADALLDRNMGTGTDSGSTTVRTVRQALRALRNKWTVAAGTYSVFKENDTTLDWSGTVVADAAAEPVVSSDPAGP